MTELLFLLFFFSRLFASSTRAHVSLFKFSNSHLTHTYTCACKRKTHTHGTREMRAREIRTHVRGCLNQQPANQATNRPTNQPASQPTGLPAYRTHAAHTRRLDNGFLTGRNVNRHSDTRHSVRESGAERQLLVPVAAARSHQSHANRTGRATSTY